MLEFFTANYPESQVKLPDPPYLELIADCMAGDYMAQLNKLTDVVLSDQDLSNITTALGLITDGIVHGTAEQRAYAFMVGYTGQYNPCGPPSMEASALDAGKVTCIQEYWKYNEPFAGRRTRSAIRRPRGTGTSGYVSLLEQAYRGETGVSPPAHSPPCPQNRFALSQSTPSPSQGPGTLWVTARG